MLNCALPTMAEKANEWRPEYLSWGFQSPPSSLYLTSVYGKEPVVSDHLSLVSELRPGSARFPHAPEQYKILRESRQARASTLCFLCTILITGRDYNKKKVKTHVLQKTTIILSVDFLLWGSEEKIACWQLYFSITSPDICYYSEWTRCLSFCFF